MFFGVIFFSQCIDNAYSQEWTDHNDSDPGLSKIPDWVKQVVRWWSEDTISDHEFANGLGFLIKEKVIEVDIRIVFGTTNQEILQTKDIEISVDKDIEIPDWIRNSAKWYTTGEIPEEHFLGGVEHLINENIISFGEKSEYDYEKIQNKLVANASPIYLENNQNVEFSVDKIEKIIDGEKVKMFGYNNQSPGPMLIANQGDTVTINVKNNLDIPTTTHWHGLRLDYKSDGVPHITQDPIQPGETFQYTLKFPDTGIYVYHPHTRTEMQVDMGLYGNILVQEKDDNYQNFQIPLILDDIKINEKNVIEYDEDVVDHVLMGRFGNTMLINGEPDYVLEVPQNEILKFYLTNTANTRTFNFQIEGQDLKLVTSDMSDYGESKFVDSVIISPFERRAVEVMIESPGVYDIIHLTPEKKYSIGKIIVNKSMIQPNDEFFNVSKNSEIKYEMSTFKKYFSIEPELELEFDLESTLDLSMHSMEHDHSIMEDSMQQDHQIVDSTMDHASIIAQGMSMDHHEDSMSHHGSDGIEWEDEMPNMNKMSNEKNTKWVLRDKNSGKEGLDIDFEVNVGDVKKIRLINSEDSIHPMQHPFHLHGQRFIVLSENGEMNSNLSWQDSVLVPKGKTIDILVEFSNPGEWLMHCHILEHHESEMTAKISVKS
ncbi:Blue copper oxidase CueO protein [Marine Group I thaumarchaeote SCGC AAA799-E16]|uniref:Blue copper oxidase CueO protein n=4 Tax=Marine Group I TaxID=905826 RepID=A0A081RPD4_9ARCH|nr:Blue copper oxidase CueO protein [Marine Group I thaumarchaeote SCGC AAA799-N04]KER06573.1 Blue copper oxidase CueO protein [Marine Group I thaumarchaeote SCGC AAA799-E16]KFM16113.1 Blue copper oxidase CueO protein [Marine Group I thaumarchaeote SCGC AAA799-D11]KFM17850.1 Copper resistance protein A [Marine Group I thaumarchaeote SCGC RSA3]